MPQDTTRSSTASRTAVRDDQLWAAWELDRSSLRLHRTEPMIRWPWRRS